MEEIIKRAKERKVYDENLRVLKKEHRFFLESKRSCYWKPEQG
jgi:hypothetical protein